MESLRNCLKFFKCKSQRIECIHSGGYTYVCHSFYGILGILMVWTMYEVVSKARIYRCLIFQSNGTLEFQLAVTKVYECIFSGNTFIRYS